MAAAELAVRDYSGRMPAGVAAAFGKDDNEYKQRGGTRISERRRPARAQIPNARLKELEA